MDEKAAQEGKLWYIAEIPLPGGSTGVDERGDQAAANARLIAAAPDYDAAARAYIDDCAGRGFHLPGVVCADPHCARFRAAIAKAEGK